jgi:DNA-binding PadR family transcriptional regulator
VGVVFAIKVVAMSSRSHRRSPLAMVLLALLVEAPMHPYRMQQLIKEREKDKVVNVAQRNSIYQTIDRLQRAGLITVRETARDEKRPERTVYQITDEGSETLQRWLRTMLSTPAREFPEFPAALAFVPLLPPQDVLDQLRVRAAVLQGTLARLDSDLSIDVDVLPRLFLLETEYARAVTHTELQWVRSLIEDLSSGRLTWTREWLDAVAASAERREQSVTGEA